jgi:hypothetical protein
MRNSGHYRLHYSTSFAVTFLPRIESVAPKQCDDLTQMTKYVSFKATDLGDVPGHGRIIEVLPLVEVGGVLHLSRVGATLPKVITSILWVVYLGM